MYNTTKKKQLILVRHDQAIEVAEFDGSDFDRPLSLKGREHATTIGRHLRLIGVHPDAMIVSPAIRTRETAEILSNELAVASIEYRDELYYGYSLEYRDGNQCYMNGVSKTSQEVNLLMLVGHNDDLTQFARYLSGDQIPSMKKGSVLVFSVPEDMDWNTISPGSLSVLYYLTPQFLKLKELI